ncbi:MAG TPA: NHL repeat-containing protein [Acidisarcina sp.]
MASASSRSQNIPLRSTYTLAAALLMASISPALLGQTAHYLSETVSAGVADFGSVQVATTSAIRSLTFEFDRGGSIGAPAVLTQGASGLDFDDAGTGTCTTNGTNHRYSAGETCTVDVTFAAKHPGMRLGAVQLLNDGATAIVATEPIYGTGTAPQITYDPGITRSIGVYFNGPFGVATDGAGNVYVADAYGNAINEIIAVNGVTPQSPTVRTLGSGFYTPFGVAIDGAGNVYVADYSNDAVKEMIAVNGVIPDSPIIRTLGTGFSGPSGVAVDPKGNVYVADSSNNLVKEIIADYGVIGTSPTIRILGSGFSSAFGVAVDGSGNVYVADSYNDAVKEILALNGVIPASPNIITLGSGFTTPSGLALDPAGDLYVADLSNNAVKKISAVNGVIPQSPTITMLGSGLYQPFGIAIDNSGNLYAANSGSLFVNEVNLSTMPSLSFPTPTSVGSTDSNDGPQTLTIANNGNASLTFPVPASGFNPSISPGYTLNNSSTCPQLTVASATEGVLHSGAACTDVVSFAPTMIGSITGQLVVTDDNLNANATQTIALQGTGIPGVKTISFPQPPTPAFLGSTATLAATTTNGDAVAYTVIAGSATITGNTVTYSKVGTLTIAANSAASATYLAAGTVTRTVVVKSQYRYLSFSPQSANFGDVETGKPTPPISVTVINGTNATARFSAFTNLGKFTVGGGTCGPINAATSLAPASSCTFNVAFTPVLGGLIVGSFQGMAASSTTLFQLKGNGVMRHVFISQQGSFPYVPYGTTSQPITITIKNYTGSPAIFETLKDLSAFHFSAAACAPVALLGSSPVGPGTILPADSVCTFQVTLAANPGQPVSGSFIVGTAIGPISYPLAAGTSFTVSPNFIDFGPVLLGTTSSPVSVTVTNDTYASVSSSTDDDDQVFQFPSTDCGSPAFNTFLSPGQVCHFTATFSTPLPWGEHSYSGVINFSSGNGIVGMLNLTGSPQSPQ